jgi:hypothetical protein
VTGTFDNWTKTEQLEKVGQIFQKTVTLPESSDKIYYKVGDIVSFCLSHRVWVSPGACVFTWAHTTLSAKRCPRLLWLQRGI